MSEYLNSEIWVGGKLYDTREVLKINKDYEYKVIDIEGNKVTIIDNFYSNPDMIREIALNGTGNRLLNKERPGYRITIPIGWDNHKEEYIQNYVNILKKTWKDTDSDLVNWPKVQRLTFNIQKAYTKWPSYSNEFLEQQPHVDVVDKNSNFVNSLVYLNKDNEWKGKNGTGIYRHKSTGLTSVPSTIMSDPNGSKFWDNELSNGGWISESNDFWELEYLIEMKYNRMVFYSGNLFHSVYMNDMDFMDIPRIVQVTFCNIFKKENGRV